MSAGDGPPRGGAGDETQRTAQCESQTLCGFLARAATGAMEWRALQRGGRSHPGVSWSRFAVVGLVGLVFLGTIVALVLFVPASQPWLEAVGVVGLGIKAFQMGRQWSAARPPCGR